MEQKIVTRADDLYVVPSFTNPELSYLVDMNIGLCACEVGQNGTPRKHQYIIWTRIGKSQNFIPYLDTENRKQCSYIAIGKVLEDELYESIHQPDQSGFEERYFLMDSQLKTFLFYVFKKRQASWVST